MKVLVDLTTQILEFFVKVTGNPGLAIIGLTVLVRLILLPLYWKQTKSMKQMQELNPKVKAIQEKYKNDPQKMNKALMDLYREHKYNPASGCLLLLIQFPIIIALFQALQVFPFKGGFLWMPDLTKPDPIYIIPGLFNVIAVLSGITTYISQKMVTPSGDASQQSMLIMMPIFMAWITGRYAAGLGIYWVVNNIIQIIQQYFVGARPTAAKEGESRT